MPVYRHFNIKEDGDITIARFVDSALLDDLTVRGTDQEMAAMVAEDRRLIILDFSSVQTISSAALGNLIRMKRNIEVANGQLVFCGIDATVAAVFQMVNAHLFFHVSDDEEAAIRQIQGFREKGLHLETDCPVHECGAAIRHSIARKHADRWQATIICKKCITSLEINHDRETRVVSLQFPTYEDQHILLRQSTSLNPQDQWSFWISLSGPLDLFVAEALKRAWLTIPAPRYAIIDLRFITKLTDQAASVLRAMFGETAMQGDRCVIFMSEGKQDLAEKTPRDIPVCHSREAAVAAIGPLPTEPQRSFTVTVRVTD